MTKVEIIFSEPHKALRDSHGFKLGEEIKEVSFSVPYYSLEVYGLVIRFNNQETSYIYPWHTIARLKITD